MDVQVTGDKICLLLDRQEAADLLTALETYTRSLRSKWERDGIMLCWRCLEICEQAANLLRATGIEPAEHEG